MLSTLDFTGSEHWAPFNFLRSQPCITLTAEVLERSRMVTTQILLKEYQPGIEYSDD